MKVEELLNQILPAILEIDGKCPSCISEFVEDVNPLIALTGFQYLKTGTEEYPFFTVSVGKISQG